MNEGGFLLFFPLIISLMQHSWYIYPVPQPLYALELKWSFKDISTDVKFISRFCTCMKYVSYVYLCFWYHNHAHFSSLVWFCFRSKMIYKADFSRSSLTTEKITVKFVICRNSLSWKWAEDSPRVFLKQIAGISGDKKMKGALRKVT